MANTVFVQKVEALRSVSSLLKMIIDLEEGFSEMYELSHDFKAMDEG
jgi:hypothetical protein